MGMKIDGDYVFNGPREIVLGSCSRSKYSSY